MYVLKVQALQVTSEMCHARYEEQCPERSFLWLKLLEEVSGQHVFCCKFCVKR